MPRSRLIHPEFFASEPLAACSPFTRLVFIGLWQLADRDGRLKDQVPVIAAYVSPYESALEAVGEALETLAAHRLITRYTAQGKACVHVSNFLEHQHPHPNERASVLPSPPGGPAAAVVDPVPVTLTRARQTPTIPVTPEISRDIPEMSRAESHPESNVAHEMSRATENREGVAKVLETVRKLARINNMSRVQPKARATREIPRANRAVSDPVSISISISDPVPDIAKAVTLSHPADASAFLRGPSAASDPSPPDPSPPDPLEPPPLELPVVSLEPLRPLVRELLHLGCPRHLLVDAMLELMRQRGVLAPLEAIRAACQEGVKGC